MLFHIKDLTFFSENFLANFLVLLHRRRIKLTTAWSAADQLSDLTVFCRLVLVLIIIRFCWHLPHRLALVLFGAVCDPGLLFVVKRVMVFVIVVSLFAVPIGWRQDFVVVILRKASILGLGGRFIQLSCWFATAFRNVLDGFNGCLFGSNFVAKVYWVSWVISRWLIRIGFEYFTIVLVRLLRLCFNSHRISERTSTSSGGFRDMLKLAVTRLLVLRTVWNRFLDWIFDNLFRGLVSGAKSLF